VFSRRLWEWKGKMTTPTDAELHYRGPEYLRRWVRSCAPDQVTKITPADLDVLLRGLLDLRDAIDSHWITWGPEGEEDDARVQVVHEVARRLEQERAEARLTVLHDLCRVLSLTVTHDDLDRVGRRDPFGSGRKEAVERVRSHLVGHGYIEVR
jgi:hypothetical protein